MQSPEPARSIESRTSILPTLFLGVLILVSGIEFVVRGPLRFLRQGYGWNDLSYVYTPSRIWLTGHNPYDPQNFVDIWAKQRGETLGVETLRTHAAYPLTTLVVMAPISAMRWPAVQPVWALTGVLLVLLMIRSLIDVGELDRTGALAFVAMALAFAPLHTGIATGNVTIPAIGLSAIAVWAARELRYTVAGSLFGVVTCLKPQIGVCFLAYYVFRRWRVVASATATVVGVLALGVLRLHNLGLAWVHDFLYNAQKYVQANRIDDFSSTNPIRFTLINLQVPFFELTGRTVWANRLALMFGVFLVSIWLWIVTRRTRPANVLLEAGTLATLSLLPVYHRFYDATLLLLPLCWSLTLEAKKIPRVRYLIWLACIPFLVPGATLLQTLAAANQLPRSLVTSPWWNLVVMSHETWAILVLVLTLLYSLRAAVPRPGPPQPEVTRKEKLLPPTAGA